MCQTCISEPGSHSFYLMAKKEDTHVYYTCPADATKYWDTDGILKHYEEILHEKGEQDWIWVFDSRDFGLVHSLQVSTAIGLVDILKKYKKGLKEIRIINSTMYIKSLYAIISPFLNNELMNIITWKA
jgi:hypothetical protein